MGSVVTKDENGAARLILTDRESKEYPVPIDMPMDALFPPGRRQERVVDSISKPLASFDAAAVITEKYGLSDRKEMIAKATELVFSLPSVGSKLFLITIADRVSNPQALAQYLAMLTVADCWRIDSSRPAGRPLADTCGRRCCDTRRLQPRRQNPPR